VRRSQTAATWRELLFDPSGGRDLDRSVRFTTRFTLATIGAGLLLLTGCQKREGGAAGTGDINIGLAGAQSGADAQIGLSMLNGSRVAIDEWNAKGGVIGRKINPIVFDDEGKPDKAVNVAETLVDDNVVAVIGHFNSGCTIPASRVYNDAKVVEISPGSTNPQYTEQGFPYAFRVCGRDDQQGAVIASFLHDQMKLNKIAILDDKTTYGEGLATVVKNAFEGKGGTVAVFQGLDKEDTDFRANLAVVQGSGAEAIVWGGMYKGGGPLVVQLRQAGLTIPFVSDDGCQDQSFVNTVGGNAPNVFVSFGQDYTGQPAAQAFIKTYKDTYQRDVGSYSVYGYDAAQVLLTAIDKAQSTDPDKVAAVMKSQPFDTIQGKIEFDSKGDLKVADYVIWTVKDGKLQELSSTP
jgi:branched-chain amino acid transport system substrate-binding protein